MNFNLINELLMMLFIAYNLTIKDKKGNTLFWRWGGDQSTDSKFIYIILYILEILDLNKLMILLLDI